MLRNEYPQLHLIALSLALIKKEKESILLTQIIQYQTLMMCYEI